jgi:hypothetical protein
MNITSIAAIRTHPVSMAKEALSMAWALVAMVGPSPSARANGATSPVIKKTRNMIINTFRIICYPPIKKDIRLKAPGIGRFVLQLIPMPYFANALRIRQ